VRPAPRQTSNGFTYRVSVLLSFAAFFLTLVRGHFLTTARALDIDVDPFLRLHSSTEDHVERKQGNENNHNDGD
jgi:hypothetical protein